MPLAQRGVRVRRLGMVLWLTVFLLANIGLKIALAIAAVYYLLPRTVRCPVCDGETIKLVPGPVLRVLGRVCRIERRWCLGCGFGMHARGRPESHVWVGPTGTRNHERTA